VYVSKTFLKSLALIDRSWRVVPDESDNTYSIVKDVSVKIPIEGGKVGIVHGPRTVAVFQGEPIDAHLDELRRRKRWGEEMKIVENPMNELKYYKRLNDEAKAKKKELALDMMTAGFMKMHKMATSQTFIMPGDKKWPTTSQPTPDSGASIPSPRSRPQETKSE
jgi:hypothetical protein